MDSELGIWVSVLGGMLVLFVGPLVIYNLFFMKKVESNLKSSDFNLSINAVLSFFSKREQRP